MNVAVYYDLAPGGAAFALARFVEHLTRRHRVDCFAPHGAHPVADGVRFLGPPERGRSLPGPLYYLNRVAAPARARRLSRREALLAPELAAYDRILVHTCRGRGAPALSAHLGGRADLYVTEPLRLYREPRPPDGPPPALWRASRALYLPVSRSLNAADRRNARAAGRLLANSLYTAARVREVYGRDAEVVPPSLDPRFLDEPPAADDGGYLLSPGALLPQKGHGRVVRALAGWRGAPELVVAGFGGRSGTARRLHALAARSGVRLRIVADPPPGEMRRLLREARLVAVAAFREPFGLVSLEAQAAGRAVVVVDEGGLPETVIPGETGRVAGPEPGELGAAIRAVWEDGALRARLGAAGREHVGARFTPERCGEALERALAAAPDAR